MITTTDLATALLYGRSSTSNFNSFSMIFAAYEIFWNMQRLSRRALPGDFLRMISDVCDKNFKTIFISDPSEKIFLFCTVSSQWY